MSDTTSTENDPITISHIRWLGFKNENGAFVRKNVPGEIQYVQKEFHYSIDNKSVKHLKTNKDLNNIVIPIANEEIQKRNEDIRKQNN